MTDAEKKEQVEIKLGGVLRGHNGWVTQLAAHPIYKSILVSSSRDKTLIIWHLDDSDSGLTGKPMKSLHGHGHFISDVVMSSDGQYALSGSWDMTLRLWDLNTGKTTRQFKSHSKDVLSVAFSTDDRQIVSGSRDKTIKLWNTLADCKHTIDKAAETVSVRRPGPGDPDYHVSHSDWVSTVRFASSGNKPVIVSSGWDKYLKVWDMSTCRLMTNHIGHTGYLNCVTVSPDGTLCSSGGKDGSAMLWDLGEGKHLYTLGGQDVINALAFSPSRYWLCTAVGSVVKIWDLEDKAVLQELKPLDVADQKFQPQCISLAWSMDAQTLFAGYTDGLIRVWRVRILAPAIRS